MKKISLILNFLILFCSFLLFTSSVQIKDNRTYLPVFMERSELEKSVAFVSEGRDLVNPGKIYVYGKYIFINERYKGVHVIDNTVPQNPKNTAFITAPGCLDMAVKGGVLFLDNAVDLVAFDLTSHQVTERIRNVLPQPSSPDNMIYSNSEVRSKGLILVEWKKNAEAS